MTDQTTTDVFLGGALRITQPAKGYRAGMDALLVAAAIPVRAQESPCVLDVGAGVGTVGLALASRHASANVTLAEIDPILIALARRNIADNGAEHRMSAEIVDVAAGGASLHDPARASRLRPGAFSHVVSNPPYYDTGSGLKPRDPIRARAHQMPAEALDAWIAFMATAACADGSMTMIHRTEAFPRLLECLMPRFGALRIRPLHPRADSPANRILLTGIKGSRAPLTIVPPMVIHDDAGNYQPEIVAVLRDGAPIVV